MLRPYSASRRTAGPSDARVLLREREPGHRHTRVQEGGCFSRSTFCDSGLIAIPERSLAARHLATLLTSWRDVGGISYLRLAETIRLLVLDGRIPLQSQLPAERELAAALGVSRTTVSSAYARLRDAGYLRSRRGSRSWTTLPSGERTTSPPALGPATDPNVLDLAHAALPPCGGDQAAVAAATWISPPSRRLRVRHRGLRELRVRWRLYGAAACDNARTSSSPTRQHGTHGPAAVRRAGRSVLVEHPRDPNAWTLSRAARLSPRPDRKLAGCGADRGHDSPVARGGYWS